MNHRSEVKWDEKGRGIETFENYPRKDIWANTEEEVEEEAEEEERGMGEGEGEKRGEKEVDE